VFLAVSGEFALEHAEKIAEGGEGEPVREMVLFLFLWWNYTLCSRSV